MRDALNLETNSILKTKNSRWHRYFFHDFSPYIDDFFLRNDRYGTLCIRENPGCLFIATNRDAVTHLTDAQEWAGLFLLPPSHYH